MKYKLKVYSIWEFGMRTDKAGNPHQEDSLYPHFGDQNDSDRTFILCDGMGGHDAGEVASATVCDVMGEAILNDGHDDKGEFTDKDLSDALGAAYDALDKKDNGSVKKMGTTMTFLKLHDAGATMAHIGDSRVYHIRPGKNGDETRILYQSEDHSLVNDLVKMGELTHEEARHSSQKNVITRAMQPLLNPRPKAEVYKTSDIKAGDFFYLCSDGMLEVDDMEDGSVLRRVFSGMVPDDQRRVDILTGATNENRDNHTAFIVHITEVDGAPAEMESDDQELPYIEYVSRKKKATPPKRDDFTAPTPSRPKPTPMATVDDTPGVPPPAAVPPRSAQAPMPAGGGFDDDDDDDEDQKRNKGAMVYLFWGVLAIILIGAAYVFVTYFQKDEKKPDPRQEQTGQPAPQNEPNSSPSVAPPQYNNSEPYRDYDRGGRQQGPSTRPDNRQGPRDNNKGNSTDQSVKNIKETIPKKDNTKPESTKPESTKPETTKPETKKPTTPPIVKPGEL